MTDEERERIKEILGDDIGILWKCATLLCQLTTANVDEVMALASEGFRAEFADNVRMYWSTGDGSDWVSFGPVEGDPYPKEAVHAAQDWYARVGYKYPPTPALPMRAKSPK